jgi:ATP-dependent DNA helicase RecG
MFTVLLIAHAFYLDGKIEKFGRGTMDMIRDCKAVGNPLPIYEEIGGSFSVTLPLKEPMRTITYEEPQKIKLTDRQKAIMKTLQKGPLNRSQIIDKIDTKLADRVVQKELAKLKEVALVKSEGKGKAIVWVSII